jgi:hypothetical protein
LFDLLLPTKGEEPEKPNIAGMKSILKVSVITIMNGQHRDIHTAVFAREGSRNSGLRCHILHFTRSVVPRRVPGYDAEAYSACSSDIRVCGDISPLRGPRRVHYHQVIILSMVHPTH